MWLWLSYLSLCGHNGHLGVVHCSDTAKALPILTSQETAQEVEPNLVILISEIFNTGIQDLTKSV